MDNLEQDYKEVKMLVLQGIYGLKSKLTEKLFNVNDNPLLKYNLDDGMKVEPRWYIPILPLVLINGTEGIGTGFNTKIPAHNPIGYY